MLRRLAAAGTIMLAFAGTAHADEDGGMIRVKSNYSVGETLGRLKAAIGQGGGRVFTVVDHGAGAREAGADIGESKLVIFGNPKAGTPVMQANRAAGLLLPLRVLVYTEADGSVWLAHEDIEDRLDDLDGINDNDPAVQPLKAALQKLTTAAAQ